MSRAFRDTFKQTFFGYCHKFDRRESMISFAHLSQRTMRRKHYKASIPEENPSSMQTTGGVNSHRMSLSLMEHEKNKKILPMNNDRTLTLSLLDDKKSNGLTG